MSLGREKGKGPFTNSNDVIGVEQGAQGKCSILAILLPTFSLTFQPTLNTSHFPTCQSLCLWLPLLGIPGLLPPIFLI